MDNLSHTIIGSLVGETASRLIPAVKAALPEQTRRTLYLSLMMIGSNLPDADLVYSALDDSKLGYMLHHRGHTHTVVGAIVLGLSMYGLSRLWLGWRKIASNRHDHWGVAFVALLAPLLHVAMDGLNNYGVHPFWPFHNGWLYGDTIFIIEPLFWIAATPLLLLVRSVLARVFIGAALLTGIGLAFGSGFVPWPMALALTLLCVGLLLISRRVSGTRAALCGIAVWLGVIALFASAHRLAGQRVEALMAQLFPGEQTLDHVLTPMPVNPVCWEVISARRDEDRYALRIVMLSLAPTWLPAGECPTRGLDGNATAPLTAVVHPNTAAAHWYGELVMSQRELQELAHGNCAAAGFMRFARMPWYVRNDEGYLVGDLRYDREAELAFTELQLTGNDLCPLHEPPWTPPRAELLGAPVGDTHLR